jgi:hypothetical protein
MVAECLQRFDEGLIKAMSRRVNYPNGAWPTEMRAETAAGYCDEPSVEAFLSKVKLGLYPKPCKQQGTLPKWHRTKLDETIALRHGLMPVGGLIAEDVVELI